MDRKTLSRCLGMAAAAFGAAAVVAPGALEKLYGVTNNPDTRSLMRPWGTRTFLLGALTLGASDGDREKLVVPLAALNVADAALALYATALDGAPRRAAVQSAATSATFAALLLYGRRLS